MLNYDAHGIEVQVWGPGSILDAYGNTLIDWSCPVDKGTIMAVLSAPGLSSMIDGLQGRLDTTDKLLLTAADSDIDTGDQVEIDGRHYNTMGSSDTWKRHIMGIVDHLEVPLKAA